MPVRGLRTLVLIHGILSTATSTWPDTYGCALGIKDAGKYDQVIAYTYDWTKVPSDAGGEFLKFINGLNLDWFDIEAHSYGTVVTLQALPSMRPMPKNVVLVAGPLPAARSEGSASNPNRILEMVLNQITDNHEHGVGRRRRERPYAEVTGTEQQRTVVNFGRS